MKTTVTRRTLRSSLGRTLRPVLRAAHASGAAGLVLLLAIASGCSAQREPSSSPGTSEAASPALLDSSASEAGASAPADDREAPPSGQKKAASPLAPRQAESAPRSDGPPQPAAAPSAEESVERNWDELAQSRRAFDQQLEPSQLSCAGARPHRDAICSIAERICEIASSGPSTTGGARCADAQKSCTDAKSRYKARCGE